MLDLTGANLVAYLIRVVKDAVARNPRFRNTLGEVTFASNNQINWGDTQILVKSVTTSGTRLSPDYFMCTQHGRAILAKVGDKEGSFVEWVTENDKTRRTPPAGTYYFNVDAVNEQTRDVNLTVRQYRWEQGSGKNAEGTIVTLRAGIDGRTLTASDAHAGDVDVNAFEKFLYLLTPTQQLVLTAPGPVTLTPNVDFWILRKQSAVVLDKTVGGTELVNIPPSLAPFTDIELFDQDQYQLRKNLDYTFQGPNWIVLSPFTPPGSTITATATVKMNPATTIPATNPENILHVNVGPNESLAPGQIFISTTSGDFHSATLDTNGDIIIPQLLQPGEGYRFEVRILTQDMTVVGKKYELNGFKKTVWDPKGGAPDANTPGPGAYKLDLDVNGNTIEAIPGLVLAIGDAVVKGDQCAVIVNPELTETYEVFGSKENLTFALDCRANDYQTASDVSELLKRELLVFRRQNMEADGITIFEATRDNQGEQRDPSGTAPRYTFTVTVSASADWKVFVPCITRMVSFEVTEGILTPDFLGKVSAVPRLQAFGAFQFIPSYA
jgi:hypothetical protein